MFGGDGDGIEASGFGGNGRDAQKRGGGTGNRAVVFAPLIGQRSGAKDGREEIEFGTRAEDVVGWRNGDDGYADGGGEAGAFEVDDKIGIEGVVAVEAETTD